MLGNYFPIEPHLPPHLLGFFISKKLGNGVVINTCNSSAQAEVEGSQVQGQPTLHGALLASMGYYIVRSCIKKQKVNNKK